MHALALPKHHSIEWSEFIMFVLPISWMRDQRPKQKSNNIKRYLKWKPLTIRMSACWTRIDC